MMTWLYLLWGFILFPLFLYSAKGIRNPEAFFSPPFVVSLGVSLIYVFGYLAVPQEMNDWFMPKASYALTLLLALMSLYAFIIGYWIRFSLKIYRRPPKSFHKEVPLYYCLFLWAVACIGKVVFLIYSGGIIDYYSAAHGTAGAWLETSAYLYRLEEFFFPIMYLLLAKRFNRESNGLTANLFLWLTAAVLGFEAFVFGNRGDTIRLLIIFGLSYVIMTRRRPSRMILIFSGLLALAAVLLFPYVRDAVHFGSSREVGVAFTDAVKNFARSSGAGGASPSYYRYSTGSSLYFGSAVIEAVNQSESVDFGIGWAANFLNFVPRQLWPEKHRTFGRWFVSPFNFVKKSKPWSPAPGSSYGGLADGFVRLYWFAPVLWFFLGYWGGRLRKEADSYRNAYTVGYYISYLIGLVYWITQSFGAAFGGWIFFVVPIWGARVVSRRKFKDDS